MLTNVGAPRGLIVALCTSSLEQTTNFMWSYCASYWMFKTCCMKNWNILKTFTPLVIFYRAVFGSSGSSWQAQISGFCTHSSRCTVLTTHMHSHYYPTLTNSGRPPRSHVRGLCCGSHAKCETWQPWKTQSNEMKTHPTAERPAHLLHSQTSASIPHD